MKALTYDRHGETPKVSPNVPLPSRTLPSKTLMIKNYATSINPADWYERIHSSLSFIHKRYRLSGKVRTEVKRR